MSMIFNWGVPLLQKLAAATTFSGQATTKCFKTLKTDI
jgi:hypothetical protein